MNRNAAEKPRTARPSWAVVVVVLLLIAFAIWDGRPTMLPVAQGQIPDTALQRQQLLEEQQRTNELLSAILAHLRTEPIMVRIETTDKRNAPARERSGDRSDR